MSRVCHKIGQSILMAPINLPLRTLPHPFKRSTPSTHKHTRQDTHALVHGEAGNAHSVSNPAEQVLIHLQLLRAQVHQGVILYVYVRVRLHQASLSSAHASTHHAFVDLIPYPADGLLRLLPASLSRERHGGDACIDERGRSGHACALSSEFGSMWFILAVGAEPRDLILHEGDKGADHDRRALEARGLAQGHGGELVAEGLRGV